MDADETGANGVIIRTIISSSMQMQFHWEKITRMPDCQIENCIHSLT
jgi:hypothetical protein